MAERTFAPVELSWTARIRPVLAITAAAFRADPVKAGSSLALRFAGAAAGPLFAVLVARLASQATGGGSAGGAVLVASLLALAVASRSVLDEIGWKVVQILQERASHEIDKEIIALVAGLPGIEHVERPEHLDKVDRLRDDQWLLAQSIESLANWAVLLFSIVTTLAVLVSVHPLLVLLPLFGIPSVLASIRAERIRREFLDRNSADFRLWVDHLRLGTSQAAAKELRVFGLGPELVRRHNENICRIAAWEEEHRLIGAWLQTAARSVFALGYAGAILFVADRVASGSAPVGDLVLTVILAGQTLAHVRGLSGSANWLTWTFTAVRRWLWLLDYAAPRLDATVITQPVPARLALGIDLRHVTFRYPGTEVAVLRDVNLFVPAGSTVAIVGDNGAGKTTLAKLLCRFYEPTEGEVLVDGARLADLDIAEWRQRISAAFQDHAPFEFTAGEVVTLGDLARLGDAEAAGAALERAGASDVLSSLPQGLATQLGSRWPGGVDLSGGQWQKLALARGMLRDEPLVLVLDEPTAALDAETEHRLFERYADRARATAAGAGTITVLVSHRFSTVRMADLIVVVAEGRIAETGTHGDLVAAGGIYCDLFSMQARAYR
jgi:ATP-binding cassette subfamily B protein